MAVIELVDRDVNAKKVDKPKNTEKATLKIKKLNSKNSNK